ncbi:hypothetical protein AAHC03_024185 [Spirometra sp. Aus1]
MAAEINKCLQVLIIITHVYLMSLSAFLVFIGGYLITDVTAPFLARILAAFIPSRHELSMELTTSLIVKAAPAVLAVGIVLSIVYLAGLILACRGSRKKLRIYAILLGVLVAAQIVAIAYVLGDPNLISKSAVSYMEERLPLYNKDGDEESQAAVRNWDEVMTVSQDYCCGLKGYADFPDPANLQVACCSVKDKNPVKLCNDAIAQAMSPPVPGCEEKIKNYINWSKLGFAHFPIIFLTAQNLSAFLVFIGGYLITDVTAPFLSRILAAFIPSSYGLSIELTMSLIVKAAPAVLAVGIVLSIVYLAGLILACRGSRKKLRIYVILLGVLVAAQIVATAYVLGHPTLLSQSTVSYMKGRLQLYNMTGDEESQRAVRIWDEVMTVSQDYCCGLKGYADFPDPANLPVACCSMKDKNPAKLCNDAIAQAMSPPVPGCEEKIINNINMSKPIFASFPIMLIIPQVRFQCCFVEKEENC